MAVGLQAPHNILSIPGVRLAAVKAGIKYADRYDLVMLELHEQATSVGVFTRNAFCAAPVQVAKQHLTAVEYKARAFLINTGYANAGTGEAGLDVAKQCCQALANALELNEQAILPFSTGVIGEAIPLDRVTQSLPALVNALHENNWPLAAQGIMTTDTIAKAFSLQGQWQGESFRLTGMVKGSGMIRPNMATMLAFIATDLSISAPVLDQALHQAVEQSFNRVTVDGDTSTNDACMLTATGHSTIATLQSSDNEFYAYFLDKLTELCHLLSQALVRDGEGATKFITIQVKQGASVQECEDVAFTIAHSPLVKSAFFASDPNWGRILAAVGRAPLAQLDLNGVSLYLNQRCLVKNGQPDSAYHEQLGASEMQKDEITVTVELGRGDDEATVWTSDLSYDYVRINAEYRS
ncbi:MAG: bifunctional glutamate N-acetyltransferase/amino-acid acetyltransferase ArgJ [Gammaproteobacteria bacterium]|nr:bifunctional glutamate N-acetyltransferase/amino-acid acetyltransferase ArgJ [Gammaproteobacteria bacterium]MDH5728904.1 bifunctional glutamate N-acetyltransferase/amino-acid acetyltransferase ArgJ [Gammaproteobacteria bacterium]